MRDCYLLVFVGVSILVLVAVARKAEERTLAFVLLKQGDIFLGVYLVLKKFLTTEKVCDTLITRYDTMLLWERYRSREERPLSWL